MAAKPGRNDRCHCGSGRKYKHCHGPKDATQQSRVLVITVGALIVAALVVGIVSFTGDRSGGQVWDAEHGHYHNAGTGGGAGRVWSEEHGHYH